MKKRMLSMFLTLAMLVTLLPAMTATAADDWSYPTATPTLTWGGSGTEADPYTIDTAQELADLAYMVNEEEMYYGGVWFKLTANIDLNPGFTATADGFVGEGTPKQWIPIGEVRIDDGITVPFGGIFDGAGYSIKGMYLAEESCTGDAAGLFEYIEVLDPDLPGTVKNLNVENSSIYSSCETHTSIHCTALGTIVALNCSIVENCHVTNTYLTLDCPKYGYFMGIGGVVSDNNSESSKVQDCSFDGAIAYTGAYSPNMAGIVASNSGYVKNCVNRGSVNADTDRVGGIVGTNRASAQSGETDYTYGVVEDCTNYGEIHGKYKVGGIVGHSGFYNASQSYAIVKNCKNYGTVSAEKDSGVGGVVGLLTYGSILDCENYGNVVNRSDPATVSLTGGVVGECSMDGYVLENCVYLKNDTVNTELELLGSGNTKTGTVTNCRSLSEMATYDISLATVDGAQMRLTGKQGLRFTSSIAKNGDFASVKEYGTVLIPTEDVETIDDLVIGATLNGRAVCKVPAVYKYAEDDDKITFTAVITDIAEQNYARSYTARAYAILDDDTVVYGETYTSRSIYQIAKLILEDEAASDAEVDAAQAIVDAVEKYGDNDSAWPWN